MEVFLPLAACVSNSMATGDCLCVNTLCDVWKQIDDYQLSQKVKFVRQSATKSFGSDG